MGRVNDPLIDNVVDTIGDQAVGRRFPRHLPRALAPFSTPAYRRLAVSLSFGALAQGMWLVAMVWEVFRLGGGTRDLSLVATASAVGVIVPALLAGVVADRIVQKRILLTVAAIECVGMGAVGLLAFFDLTSFWLLAGVSFGLGAAMAFYYPAYSAMLPSIVPEEQLMAVNGVEGVVRPTIGQAFGPAVAGIVIGVSAPSYACWAAAAAMAISFVALLAVPRTPLRRTFDDAHPAHPVQSALRDVAEGFHYVVRTPWLLVSLLSASVIVLVMMGPLEVLIPFFIKEGLGGSASQHAWVLAAFGIGGAVGSLVMASMKMPKRYLTWLLLFWGFSAWPFAVIAHADSIWTVVAAAFLMGLLFSGPMVIWGTLLQRRVPPALLGRVSSLDFFVSISLMPVSMALVGPVSEAIGTAATFWIAAVVPTAVAVVALLVADLPADEVAHPLD